MCYQSGSINSSDRKVWGPVEVFFKQSNGSAVFCVNRLCCPRGGAAWDEGLLGSRTTLLLRVGANMELTGGLSAPRAGTCLRSSPGASGWTYSQHLGCGGPGLLSLAHPQGSLCVPSPPEPLGQTLHKASFLCPRPSV